MCNQHYCHQWQGGTLNSQEDLSSLCWWEGNHLHCNCLLLEGKLHSFDMGDMQGILVVVEEDILQVEEGNLLAVEGSLLEVHELDKGGWELVV